MQEVRSFLSVVFLLNFAVIVSKSEDALLIDQNNTIFQCLLFVMAKFNDLSVNVHVVVCNAHYKARFRL